MDNSVYEILVKEIDNFSTIALEKGDFTYITGWTQWWYNPTDKTFIAMKNKQVPKNKAFSIYFADTFNGHLSVYSQIKHML